MDRLAREILEGATPSLDDVIDAWGVSFPLLHELEETPQDPDWHAEGDVRVHTSMVLEETYAQLDELRLTPERRLSLILGAIFHDIAKPFTTRRREFDGRERIIAPRHAEEGRSYLGFRILELGLPDEVTRHVLSLVAYHHEPNRLVRKEKSARSYRHLARLADIELLYHLEVADMRGRRCADREEQLDSIELFRLFAQDHGVFAGQRALRSLYDDWHEHIEDQLAEFDETTREFVFLQAVREAESGTIYTPEEAVARSYQYRDAYAELVVLCGPSGSGKSSWVRDHLSGWEVVSMDAIRRELTGDVTDQSRNGQVLQLAKERLKDHLRNHRKVVWDSTNLRRDFRQLPLGLGFDYGAFTRLVVFHLPPGEAHRRNRERERSVPADVLDRQLESVQWPSLDEAHHVEFLGPHDGSGER